MGCGSSYCNSCKAKSEGKRYVTDRFQIRSENFKKFVLSIDQTRDEERDHITNMLNMVLPDIKGLKITSDSNRRFELGNFLVNCIPESLPLFYLQNFKIDESSTLEPTDIQSVVHSAKRVTEEFNFAQSELSKDNFVEIIEAAGKGPVINFFDCKFTGESTFEIDSEIEFEIKDISLHNGGSDEEPNKLTIGDLENLVIGISKSSLKDSLKTIQFEKAYANSKKLKKIFSKYQMNDIKVVITKPNKNNWKFL